jgi:tRNA threonylcarbamoyladenosine biosynthesis protein TsaB
LRLSGPAEVSVSESQPRLLILETSGRAGLVALALGADLRQVHRLDEARRNARDLAPAVADLLSEQGWTARQLDAVLVGRGPGSYTGLRVGLMSAKTLAYATGCALIGLDTFAVIAQQVPPECLRLDVLADAQQDRVYVQSFARGEGGWLSASDLAIVSFTAWQAGKHPDAWVSGPGLTKWRGQVPAEVNVAPEPTWLPGAQSMLALGLARFQAGQRDDAFTLEPLYLRPSSAEEQWRGR